MKREHKYRAKRLDNGEWVMGTPVWSVNDRCYMIVGATEDAVNTRNEVDFMYIEVDPETVGEYTGLKDVNGAEIYEGDRVEYITDIINYIPFKERGVVEYNSDIAMFILNVEADTIPLSYCRRGIDVIGNIQDNPELLKK